MNLGGWLLLERGPSQPFFEDEGVPGDLDEEWGFCQELKRQGAEAAIAAVTAKALPANVAVRIKEAGLGADVGGNE